MFEKHGIKHLSPSSINLFIAEPSLWVLRYLFKDKIPSISNPAMTRGSLVDEALGKGLIDKVAQEDLIFDAKKKFFEITAEHFDNLSIVLKWDHDTVTKEANSIPHFIKSGLPFYQNQGKLISHQQKVELDVGLEVPVIGYTDLVFEEKICDIKTTFRTPSAFSLDGVMRQLTVYALALNKMAEANYFVKLKNETKVVTFPIDNVEQRQEEIEMSCHAIRNLLATSENRFDILRLLSPNFSNFRWEEEEKIIFKELFFENTN